MKPATYNETTEIISAWVDGALKALLVTRHITYHCAMMRISRFKKEYPVKYKKIIKEVMK
jgi:hypothetical protein